MKHYVAIDNVCAWPNLTKMPDGAIVATIFNQPCHGQWEGDVECWTSNDNGLTWHLKGTPAPHEPGTNRMNVAAGLAGNQDLIVLASGWSDKPVANKVKKSPFRSEILRPWVCRSNDGGTTWEQTGEVQIPQDDPVIPFGDILPGADGALHATAYAQGTTWFLTSRDDGRTWKDAVPLAGDGRHNETDILHLDNGKWLAASRTQDEGNLELFASDDDGATWQFRKHLTGPAMHPAHLTQLQDGRILLSFGIRFGHFHGVGIRMSEDQGTSWGTISVITHTKNATDNGYPSSIELDDGTIATAWYANASDMHARYHMGVTVWHPDEV